MPTGFHCPNPVCRHVFPPNAVSGVGALNCPRCGATFQFRSANAPAPQPGGYPTGRPAGPPPGFNGTPTSTPHSAPPPAYPAVPAYATTGDSSVETFSLGGESIEGGKYRRRGGGMWKLLLVFLIVGGGVAGVAYYIYTHGQAWFDAGGQANVTEPTNFANTSHIRSKQFNYSFQVPAAPWAGDADAMQKLQANLLLHRSEPDAWLALAAKDYKAQEPQEDEMLDDTVARLKKVFEPLEYEAKGEGQLGGQRAAKVLFQGTYKTIPVKGEVLLMTSQGISYAFITWAATEATEKMAGEFEEVRQRFSLMNYRDNWTGKRVMAVVYPGTTGPFTIQDSRALWKKNADLMKQLNADLALEASDPNKPDVKTDAATLVVLLQPKRADLKTAAAQARIALEKEQKKDFPKTKVEIVKDEAGALVDKDGPVGNMPGHIVKLHVINGENRQRFVTQATIAGPEQTIVVQGECPWERRSVWEKSFDQLLATVKIKK